MHKSQSGRSMMEMLGVLAIIGVLSVGALAGYSMAMSRYLANKAASEIEEILFNVIDLHETRRISYQQMGTLAGAPVNLKDMGVVPEKNVLGNEILVYPAVGTSNMGYFIYDHEGMCEKIILARDWLQLPQLEYIAIDGGPSSWYAFNKGTDINMSDVFTECKGANSVYISFGRFN
jgi:type II secretory pathway pseudopilin PulG